VPIRIRATLLPHFGQLISMWHSPGCGTLGKAGSGGPVASVMGLLGRINRPLYVGGPGVVNGPPKILAKPFADQFKLIQTNRPRLVHLLPRRRRLRLQPLDRVQVPLLGGGSIVRPGPRRSNCDDLPHDRHSTVGGTFGLFRTRKVLPPQ
jgi:hypothetical protein